VTEFVCFQDIMGSAGLLIRKNVTRLNVRKAVVAILRSGDLDAYAKIVREAAEPLDGDGYFYTPQIGKNFKRNRSLNLFGSTKWLIPRDIWHCDVAITPECESFWSESRGVIVRQKHLCELPDRMEGDCQQPHPYSNWEYRVELTDIEVKREALINLLTNPGAIKKRADSLDIGEPIKPPGRPMRDDWGQAWAYVCAQAVFNPLALCAPTRIQKLFHEYFEKNSPCEPDMKDIIAMSKTAYEAFKKHPRAGEWMAPD
jgi:hypothetical protein